MIQARTGAEPAVERHLGQLDALRGIAILGVLLVHATGLSQQVGAAWILGYTGQRGVQLFYMISAFTLCLSLGGGRPEKHPLANYFIRRFFRIAPLFYLAIIANLVLKYLAPEYSSLRYLGRVDVLLGFLFLNGLRPRAINNVVTGGWSIAVETTFYLMLPLLHRYFKTVRRTLLLFLLTAPLLWLVSRILVHSTTDPIDKQFFSFLWFPVEFPVFVLGILTYCIWRRYIQGPIDGSGKLKDVSRLLLAASFLIYCGCLPFNDLQLYSSSFLFVPLILGLSIHPWPLLVNRFTRFIGKISYSLYLVQFFVLSGIASLLTRLDRYPGHLVSRHIAHHPLGLLLVMLLLLGLSVPISMLTWKFIEQPGIRLGRRLIARREGRSAASGTPIVPSLHALEAAENTRDAQF